MRIFIGFVEISGYFTNLKQGFDQLGIDCTFIEFGAHPFQYQSNRNRWVRLIKYVTTQRMSTPRSNIPLKVFWIAAQKTIKVLLFIWALAKYDVFIFGFGSSFWNFHELLLLKILRKKVIYVYHGSDSRPPYIDGFLKNPSISQIIARTREIKAHIKKVERYADLIIDNPLAAHFHEKPIVALQVLGLPLKREVVVSADGEVSDCFREQPNTNQLPDKLICEVRVLHAPSDPIGKGTYHIRHAIENLKKKGHGIDYIEITGKSNATVVQELSNCDFVVDQLYSDTPMAGLATEAAFLGKASVVGGYALEQIEEILPPETIPPAQFCHPDKLEEAIERLIVDKGYRISLGGRAKEFVEANWTPLDVAARYRQLIEGHVPEEWIYHPNDIRYLHGYGRPETQVRKLVGQIIEIGGKEALELSDKPELERLFLEFASVEAKTTAANYRAKIEGAIV